MGCLGGCCLALLAVVAPPFPVLWRTGVGSSLLLVCIFTVLGWIPGVFYAWYIIIRYPDGKRSRRRERPVKEVHVIERRTSRSSYGGSQPGGTHHHHSHHSHHSYGPPRAGYGPPPPAAQGLYYAPPPQETGHVRRTSRSRSRGAY